MKETAKERLTRMFNMGKYGENLAQEILDQAIEEWEDLHWDPMAGDRD